MTTIQRIIEIPIEELQTPDAHNNMSKRERIYLYLSGYVKEDLTEIDPILIQWFYSVKSAITFAKSNVHIQKSKGLDSNLHDYHIIQCRKTIRGWVEIEGSEKHLTDEYVHDLLQQHSSRYNPRTKHSGCEEAMYSD